jgi:hypothetical protein
MPDSAKHQQTFSFTYDPIPIYIKMPDSVKTNKLSHLHITRFPESSFLVRKTHLALSLSDYKYWDPIALAQSAAASGRVHTSLRRCILRDNPSQGITLTWETLHGKPFMGYLTGQTLTGQTLTG